MPTLGQLNAINIFVDLVLTKIGEDFSGTPGETPSITIAENKIISTSMSFYNITENNYASASSDEKELLIKDGWKITAVEYPYVSGDGGTLYHVGDSFDATGEGNGIYINLEPSGSLKKSVDLTTLPGWSSLSDGTHNITIVAKADGYRDSEPSAAVSVTKGPQEYTDCITFTGESSDFTLKATNKEWDGTVEYSTDHNTWTVWNGTEISSSNKKLYLRGSGNTTFCTRNGARFVLSARAACSGNIQTLLEYSNPPATILADFCYRYMFNGCTSLTKAPELPATTLAGTCYEYMFSGCTSLTQAPALPATTLATYCYRYMFNGCTSLTKAPALPATTLADFCYEYMFKGCTSLKISTTQSSEYPTAWRIPSSGTISSTFTNWNYDMLTGTGGTFTSNPAINTTYYGAWTVV